MRPVVCGRIALVCIESSVAGLPLPRHLPDRTAMSSGIAGSWLGTRCVGHGRVNSSGCRRRLGTAPIVQTTTLERARWSRSRQPANQPAS
ncbi:hypothetical protein IWX50DRAFT_647317, partial [Phyllosticta citricarpa]